METWKPVVGFPRYEVSSNGRVRAVTESSRGHHPKMLKLRPQKSGYLRCNLSRDGKVFTCLVHRLVAIAFLTPDPSRPTVNHLNGKKTDNRPENLVWATLVENNKHSAHKRFAATNPKRALKFTLADVKAIRKAHKNGELSSAIAQRFDCSPATVRNIVYGRSWRMP